MSVSMRVVQDRLFPELQSRLPRPTYDLWFSRLRVLSWDEARLDLAAPNRYTKHWIEAHYQAELLQAARAVSPGTTEVHVTVEEPAAPATTGAAPLARSLQTFLPNSPPARPAQLVREDGHVGAAHGLDSFVAGESNRVAYTACRSIAEAPATQYNPLVVFGDSGLGKTRLLRGLALALRQKHPEWRVRLVSAEEFANAFIQAVQDRKLEALRQDFRRCDVLLMDDVHFLAGKEKTQEELLFTYESLHHAGRQLAFTCDRHPREVRRLDPRLQERLCAGLVARLAPPSFEQRVEVLRVKARARALPLEDALAELLALRVERSVRELEGVICKLAALSAAEARPPDKAMVLLALRELGYLREGPLTLEEVMAAVVQVQGLDADQIRSDKRLASLVRARHLAMYLARQLTPCSLTEIGRFFGNRDHATVIHACRRIEAALPQDEALRNSLHLLRRTLGR